MATPDAFLDGLRSIVKDAVREALAEARPATADEYISAEEAGDMIDVEPATIREWVKLGKLPRYNAGRLLRVKRSDVEAVLRARNDAPESPEEVARARFGRATTRRTR